MSATLQDVVPLQAPSAAAVILGEESGAATAALLDRGMSVVSVLSRRLNKWIGEEGRFIKSTPIDKSFGERVKEVMQGAEGQQSEKESEAEEEEKDGSQSETESEKKKEDASESEEDVEIEDE